MVAVARRLALRVHGNKNRSGFQQLHLLVLRNEKLGGVLPFRSVFPTKQTVNSENFKRGPDRYVEVTEEVTEEEAGRKGIRLEP